MSTSVGKIVLDLGLNTKGFKQEVMGIQSVASKAFGALASILSAKLAYDFAKSSINLASSLIEVQNVVDVTFGAMAQDINDFSKSAITNLGLSELAAKKYSSVFGAMFKSSKIPQKTMVEMSKGMTSLVGDFASFYNMDHEEAFMKLRSGIVGEIEPLRRIGINMDVAAMQAYLLEQGMSKNWNTMTQGEKIMTRYNYLLSRSGDAQGDFLRTQDQWANQVRILGQQFDAFKTILGESFIMILAPVVKVLNSIIMKLQIVASYFRAFIALITGNSEKVKDSASSAGGAISGMGDSTEEAADGVKKAGKKVKGALSAFDMLNVLAESTGKAMDDVGSGVGDISDLNFGKGEMALDMDLISEVDSYLNKIRQTLALVGQAFQNIFGGVVKTAITSFMSLMQSTWNLLSMVFTDIVNAVTPLFDWLIQSGLPLIASFAEESIKLLTALFDYIIFIFSTLWSKAVKPAMDLIAKIVLDGLNIIKDFWYKWGVSIFNGLIEIFAIWKTLFMSLWTNILGPIWTIFLSTLSSLWDNHFKAMTISIFNFVGALVNSAIEIYNKFIAPIIGWLIEKLGPTFVSIFASIAKYFGNYLTIISDGVTLTMNFLTGLLLFITDVFTGDWESAWTKVSNVFTTIWTGMKLIVKGIMNSIIDMVNGVITPIVKAINSMITSLNKVTAKVGLPGIPTMNTDNMKIPRLAMGGLATGPTLAMVGDNRNAKSDPEVIAPLSKLQDILGNSNQAVLEVLLLILTAIESKDQVIEIDGEKLSKVVRGYTNSENNRIGKSLITVGGAYL